MIKLNDFLNIYLHGMYQGCFMSFSSISEWYKKCQFHIIRIVCKDGFRISIRCSKYDNCKSENGIQEFGYEWKLVEWGYPSEVIDAVKYNAEESGIMSTIGSCSCDLLDELFNEHKGIDVLETLKQNG